MNPQASTTMKVHISGRGVLHGTTLIDPASKIPRCHRFSRVPYALPPTGERRWKRPVPLPSSFCYGSDKCSRVYDVPSTPCPQFPINSAPVTNAKEDCLQCNIWVPIGEPPPAGWPVLFYIHGGFLQVGSNNTEDPSALLGETDVKCIIVSPNYRLGIFGFLSSVELCWPDSSVSNFGFWDQRLALEWTYETIESFGGNRNNITVAGLSAGSYSTFHQLAHDIGTNAKTQIIRRVMMWSNGCGVQPKLVSETQDQFDDLLVALNISLSLNSKDKLDKLRAKSPEEILTAQNLVEQKFFRPILDGHFISKDLFPSIFNGDFGARMKELNIQIVIGDLTQEHHIYKYVLPPDSYDALVRRLRWDYPRHIALAICQAHKQDQSSATGRAEWQEIFGKVYADMQIHSSMRGFIGSIESHLPLSHVSRYRIDWRVAALDKKVPRQFGPTHGTDLAIWFFGNGLTLTESEKMVIREWLEPIAAFLKGEKPKWNTKTMEQVRYLTSDGRIKVCEDEWWQEKLPLWTLTRQATIVQNLRTSKL